MDANETIRNLAQKLELRNPGFDATGHMTIELGSGLIIYATLVDNENIEWSVPLKDFDFADPDMMAMMLVANCFGAATGAGRLAVDGDQVAYYCERWVVRGMSEQEAELRFDEFAATATYWIAEGVDSLLEQAAERRTAQRDSQPPSSDEEDEMFVMRV